MKTLILFRHGKPDRDVKPDFERPLTERGMDDAETMGRIIKQNDQLPDRLISSPAKRARTTAELAIEAGGWTTELVINDVLYESDCNAVLDTIHNEPDSTSTLMLLGHEPTWTETVCNFIGDCRFDFPSAGMVRIDFDVDSWEDIQFNSGTLIWLLMPKLFSQR